MKHVLLIVLSNLFSTIIISKGHPPSISIFYNDTEVIRRTDFYTYPSLPAYINGNNENILSVPDGSPIKISASNNNDPIVYGYFSGYHLYFNDSLIVNLNNLNNYGHSEIVWLEGKYYLFAINDVGAMWLTFYVKYEPIETFKTDRSEFVSRINLFPNPSSDNPELFITDSIEMQLIESSLFNIHGQLMEEFEFIISDDSFSHKIPMENLPSGAYFLVVLIDDGRKKEIIELIKL